MRKAKLLTPAQLQALITSIPVHCASTVFSVSGRTFTAPQAVTFLSSLVSTQTGVNAVRAQLRDAIQAQEAAITTDGIIAKEIRDVIGVQFSTSQTTLNDFGILPKKAPKPLTGEERAAATAKANATRKARGTSSKKQKAEISGNVTGVNITPVTAPVVPAAAIPAASATPVAPAPATSVASSTAPVVNGAITPHG